MIVVCSAIFQLHSGDIRNEVVKLSEIVMKFRLMIWLEIGLVTLVDVHPVAIDLLSVSSVCYLVLLH